MRLKLMEVVWKSPMALLDGQPNIQADLAGTKVWFTAPHDWFLWNEEINSIVSPHFKTTCECSNVYKRHCSQTFILWVVQHHIFFNKVLMFLKAEDIKTKSLAQDHPAGQQPSWAQTFVLFPAQSVTQECTACMQNWEHNILLQKDELLRN